MGSFFSKPQPRSNVYADHPFKLIATPTSQLPKGVVPGGHHRAASEMALAHNMFFRGLNSIYLQAPYIQPQDVVAFCNYTVYWHAGIHHHHHGEETEGFPEIERITGEKGLMDVNVKQHELFHDGLESVERYAKECIASPEKYDGKKLVDIIDGMKEDLEEHLHAEIGTILAMEKFGPEKMVEIEKVFANIGESGMKNLGMTTGVCAALVNLDDHFENDLWLGNFPPGATNVVAFLRAVPYWVHSDWWKFGSCDRTGTMQPLYAGPKETVV